MATVAAILAAADSYAALQTGKEGGGTIEGAVFSGRLGTVEIWDDGTVYLDSKQKAYHTNPGHLERIKSDALFALKKANFK